MTEKEAINMITNMVRNYCKTSEMEYIVLNEFLFRDGYLCKMVDILEQIEEIED